MPHSRKMDRDVAFWAKAGSRSQERLDTLRVCAWRGMLGSSEQPGAGGQMPCPSQDRKGGLVRGMYPGLCAAGAGGAPERALVRGPTGAAVNEEVGTPGSAVRR